MTDFPAPHRFTPAVDRSNPLHGALLSSTRRAFAAILRAIRQNAQARAARRAARYRAGRLEYLDDRMLRDIGITRADLDYALSHPGDPDKTLRKARSANRASEAERPTLSAW
ncbi:hypothetical protein [Vannielia litorea]|uniref:hypothetical protein n=1 Tax=Vannielia litorea TaxID=1217970 RepID=UPI001BCD8F53|nr:hypothetical protein [Vannielia litorea]MBS8226543.1 hypothetical protein [Vannielia litorea]